MLWSMFFPHILLLLWEIFFLIFLNGFFEIVLQASVHTHEIVCAHRHFQSMQKYDLKDVLAVKNNFCCESFNAHYQGLTPPKWKKPLTFISYLWSFLCVDEKVLQEDIFDEKKMTFMFLALHNLSSLSPSGSCDRSHSPQSVMQD